MAKRKKLKNTRPKAFLGVGETAAIIAQTAAQVASMGLQTAATYSGAKQQADAQVTAAKQQADALKSQNANNNKLQTQMMEFTREQNEANRRVMRDMQMNLQLQAGAQSMRDRREASKIVVKYGGKKSRKLRNAESSLQGSNIPFRVTDGGGVVPVGQTPEGFDVYELYGNDHEHYHKSQGGKNKTGVGIKFADGMEIEGEGNQNKSHGELMITTPNDAYFISNHSIAGFNPAKAVREGMPPIQAYLTQENIKAAYGISNDDDNKTPVKRKMKLAGGVAIPYYDTFSPYAGIRVIPGATTLAVEQSQNDNIRNSMKKGGSTKKELASLRNRRKAAFGSSWWHAPLLSGAGNLLGAGLSALGMGLGSNYLSKRVGEAGNILADAYGKLQGVNFDAVFGDNGKLSFSQGHYMPAIRSSYVNVNPQLEQVTRDTRRQTRAVNNNTLSSAARLSRTNLANVSADEARSRIYADKANREEQIKQHNIQMINDAAARNAELDIEMNKNYTATRADLAKFNANIENEKILGAAEARADVLQQQGAIGAQKRQGIANALGSGLASAGSAFATALDNREKYQHELDMALLQGDDSTVSRYFAMGFGNKEDAMAHMDKLKQDYLNNPYSMAGKSALSQYNMIAVKYGLPTFDPLRNTNVATYNNNITSRYSAPNLRLRGVRGINS